MKRRHCYIGSGADLNRQVLTDPETFYSGGLTIRGPRGSALDRLRRGVISSNGDTHRDTRRLVSPLFQLKAVRQYFPSMVDVARREFDRWPLGKKMDVSAGISHLSLLVSAQNLLAGQNLGDAQRLAERTAAILKKSCTLRVQLLPLTMVGTPYRRLIKHVEVLEGQLLEMVDGRPPQTQDSPHLLDRLIGFHRAHPDCLPREDLVAQMFALFGASHETVARAVTWSLFLLAQHPGILAELDQELRARCGGEPPTLDDLDELPLLDAVTKEAMRLFPPVPLTRRIVRRDGQLNGFPISPSDVVILSHFSTHRDPDVFPQPDQFRPERWFGAAFDSFAYLPFSAGPRTCFGKVLGTATINLLVAMTVQRFRLTMAPRSRIDRSVQVTLAPKYGMPMIVERPDGRFHAIAVKGNVHQMVDLTRSEATTRERTIRIDLPMIFPFKRTRQAA
jgi:cytochrome P450